MQLRCSLCYLLGSQKELPDQIGCAHCVAIRIDDPAAECVARNGSEGSIGVIGAVHEFSRARAVRADWRVSVGSVVSNLLRSTPSECGPRIKST